MTLGSPYFLLTDLPDIVPNHNGGTLRFGTDGMLLMSIGDDQAACGAQNLNIPVGKILRLNVSAMPGEGTGPPPKSALVAPGHPYDTGPNARLVAAWGLRNPFRFTVDQETGVVVIGDVGRDTMEEIDLLFPSALGPNYGWPQLEGTINPMCCGGCGEGNEFTAPIYAYPHTEVLHSVIAGPMLRPGGIHGFPIEYDGDILVAEFFVGWIRRLTETGGTWSFAPPVPGQPSATDWALGFGYIGDMQLGPDGGVYILQSFDPAPVGVRRIQPVPATSVGDAVASDAVRLEAHPSPARIGQSIRIQWTGGRGLVSKLAIRDVSGRVVRTLSVDESGEMTWDGRTDEGAVVSAGTYFARAEISGGGSASAKLVLLR